MPPTRLERLAADDWVGSVLSDRWHLGDVLDRWGTGLCFRAATAGGDERSYRVRLFRPPAVVPAQVWDGFFATSQRLAARTAEDGLLPIRDAGRTADGTCWLVTDDWNGVTLDDLIAREGPLQPERAARLAAEVCEALSTAHADGALHLCLTPDSVVVAQPGSVDERVLLTDFGLASVSGGSEPGAPEVERGDLPDSRADVWGVGNLLSRMVAGTTKLPVRLEALIHKCTALDPRNRPTSPDRLLKELIAVAEGRGGRGIRSFVRLAARIPRVALLYAAGVAIGAGVVAVLALALESDPASRDLERGEHLLATGAAAGAVLAYERALESDQGRAEIHRGLARAREALGLSLAAIDAWRGYLELVPASADGNRSLARLLLHDGRAAEAVASANKAVGLDASNPAGHRLQGQALEASGDLAGAATSYERAAALDPSDPEIHARLGAVLAGLPERRERAREALAEAVRLEPGRVRRRVALADFLRESEQDCNAAIPHYRTALTLDDKSAAAEHGLGLCLAESGEGVHKAERHLLRATRLAPGEATFHLSLGRLRRDSGRGCAAALPALEAAAAVSPESATILGEVAACRRGVKDWCGAADTYEGLMALDPGLDTWRVRQEQARRRCAR